MRYSSHCRAINAPPCYHAAHSARSHETHAFTAPAFPREFHCTRNARKRMSDNASAPLRARTDPSSIGPWSVAFAVMMVANLTMPAAMATPMLSRIPNNRRGGGSTPDNATTLASEAQQDLPDDVEMHPINAVQIKSDYTFREFLRAVATASAPFRHLGKTIGEAYSAVSDKAVDRTTLDEAQRVGDAVDAATGLISDVQLARLPGHLADLVVDALDGKAPQPERLADFLQLGAPRTRGSQVPMQPESASAQAPESHAGIDAHEPVKSPHVFDAASDTLPDNRPVGDREIVERGAVHAGGDTANPGFRIEGEHAYLQGYEQALEPAHFPPGPRRQWVTIDGRHYLGGASGYYRVTPGARAGLWLVDAPRGTRAQVPVTYNAQTGEWRAEAPLRLCGGGCGPSRESTPDSVAMSKNDVADAIRHIADRDVRDAIQQAYSDLAQLHLMRTNREDLRPWRDNSIVEHRRILARQLMRLDPYATLFEQQREAALITAIHYDNYVEYDLLNLSPEAFCQENAEILFHYLLIRGVPSHHIRMITVQPQGRPPHVMVLYTESDQFIDLLDLSTPQPPVTGHVDGISGERFTAAVYLTRDTTALLDPWSRIKASSFKHANDIEELMRMLDFSLADTGHRPASPYTVSLTRPYPTPRERAAAAMRGAANMGSSGRSGTPSGTSIRSNPSLRNSPIQPADDNHAASD